MNEELELEKLNDLAIHYPVYLIDAAAEHFNGDECKLEAIAVVLSGLDALCISIRLPNSRLLDYDDQTTVLVQLVKDKSAVQGMRIAVTDKNDNYAADQTGKAGQITVPIENGKTNEDGKVTEGYEDADRDRWTLTIKVVHTDTGRPIQGSEVSIYNAR